MAKQSRSLLIFILGLLSALGPFSIDMYLPGFPTIAASLHTTVDYVSYSLSSFFIGICIGQMVSGPLLDRFGRKRPLYIGLLIYILASFGCAVSGSVEMLISFRFLQALGGCVGMVAPRAIVRDIFPVSESAKIFSLLMLVIAISPIVAPTAGGFVVSNFGWHSIFIVLMIIAAILLVAVIFLLPESRKPDPSFSLKPRPITRSFLRVMREPQFYTYALAGATTSAGLYAYIAGSPFVFMKIFNVNEQQYGWIFAIVAMGLIGSSQLNNLFLRKYSSAQIIKITMPLQACMGILLFIGTALHWLELYGTILLIFLFLSGQGFSFPNSSALSMAPFTKEAGSASALMGAIQMGFGAVASALVGLFNNGTALPMAAVMVGCACIGSTILLIGGKRLAYKTKYGDVEEQMFDLIEKY